MAEEAYEVLFPRTECEAAAGELSAWTTVQDIAAAARFLAGEPAPGDMFDRRLAIPFADDDVLERIIIEVMGWLIAAYRVPEAKIELAQLIEPRLTEGLRRQIAAIAFHSSVKVAPSGAIMNFAPALAEDPGDRYFLVEDDPCVIELVQNPLRAMMSLIRSTYHTARYLRETKVQAAATGSPPMIFHRPYADSRLPAVVEALAFYACGLDIGPRWATGMEFDFSYKAVNVHGAPPFDATLLQGARDLTSSMLDSLT
jgi:hypothetical protein